MQATNFIAVLALFGAFTSCCSARILRRPKTGLQQETNQSVLITLGGYNNDGGVSEVDIYALTTNSSMKRGAEMPSGLGGFGSVRVNNTVYIVGGSGTDTFWSYDIVTNMWNSSLPSVPVTTTNNAAVELDGRIYTLGGGWNGDVYVYDIAQKKWAKIETSLPETADYPCAAAQGNSIYYMAPTRASGGANFYRSDDGAKTWKQVSSPQVGMINTNCIAITGTDAIMKIGGWDQHSNGGSNVVELYNTTTDKWTPIGPLNNGRGDVGSAQLPNSKDVMVCGGNTQYDSDPFYSDLCEIYKWDVKYWKGADFKLKDLMGNFGMFAAEVNA